MKIWQVWAAASYKVNGETKRKHISKGYTAASRELAILKMKRELVDCEYFDIKIRASKLVHEEDI